MKTFQRQSIQKLETNINLHRHLKYVYCVKLFKSFYNIGNKEIVKCKFTLKALFIS